MGPRVTAARLGVSYDAGRRFYRRWRIHGKEVLMGRKTHQGYSFELKLEVVQRFLDGEEAKTTLAEAYKLSSPTLLETWVRKYRSQGEDGLRPKAKGRPRKDPSAPPLQLSEVEKLRRENELLRAENDYLKKLRALREQEQQ
jgi:transposase